jgi:hypothetical protein
MKACVVAQEGYTDPRHARLTPPGFWRMPLYTLRLEPLGRKRTMADEYEYEIHKNKRPDKTYISRSLAFKRQEDRRIRIASKVIDSSETHSFAIEHGEHVIRVTDGGRQEIVAKFYEDNRGVYVLTLQRFTTETGVPHQTHFSFVGEEIPRLLEFISNLRLVQFPNDERVNVTDRELKKLLLSPDQIRNVLVQNQELVLQLARSEITTSDRTDK